MTEIADVTTAAQDGGTRKPKGTGLDAMHLPELKQLAGSLGIRGTGTMRKGQLIAAIQGRQSGAAPSESANGSDDIGEAVATERSARESTAAADGVRAESPEEAVTIDRPHDSSQIAPPADQGGQSQLNLDGSLAEPPQRARPVVQKHCELLRELQLDLRPC